MLRLKQDRKSYIPAGAIKVADKNSDAVAYLYSKVLSTGQTAYLAVGFCGKRQKPDFHYRHSTEAKREENITRYFEVRRSELTNTKNRAAERNVPGRLVVGTVLTGSWGYDQTNVEAWQVVEVSGKNTVKIRRVAVTSMNATSSMSEYVIPCPDQFQGEEILTKRVQRGTSISLDHCNLSPWEGKPLYSSWYA